MFDFLKRKPAAPAQPPPSQNGSPLVRAVMGYSERVFPMLLDVGPVTSGLAPWMLGAALVGGA